MDKQVEVFNIIFMQTEQDIEHLCNELNAESLYDVSDKDLFNYLDNWFYGDLKEHDSNIYNYDDIDTEFLGYRTDQRKTKEGYLLSKNTNLNYCGLSYFKTV